MDIHPEIQKEQIEQTKTITPNLDQVAGSVLTHGNNALSSVKDSINDTEEHGDSTAQLVEKALNKATQTIVQQLEPLLAAHHFPTRVVDYTVHQITNALNELGVTKVSGLENFRIDASWYVKSKIKNQAGDTPTKR